jgi:soluble lytic murein transglycosylase
MRRRTRWLLGAAVLALGLAAVLGLRRALVPPDLSRHDAAIRAAAAESKVDPDLLRGLVAAESGGDASAVSRAGALGLAQLMPATAREECERRGIAWPGDDALLTDPALNLRLGAGYLARQLARFDGSEPFALAAYNAGATNVNRWRARAPDLPPLGVIAREAFPETRAYVRKVLDYRDAYRAQRP